MSYENPEQPEGINVSPDNPLRELFVLLAAVITAVVALVILLSNIAGWLATFIPFSTEEQLAELVGVEQLFRSDKHASAELDEKLQQRKAFVLHLSSELIERADIDDEIVVSVHYNPSETVNAFATLGGHIVMYEGLLAKLPNENALAMVLAHEIGHIKMRHPVVAMGRGLTVSVALGSIFGLTDNAFVGRIVEWIGYSSSLSFSRSQEREADAFAADLLIDYYGHLNGAEDLFAAFSAAYAEAGEIGNLPSAEFLSTHPGLAERIDELHERAHALGSSGQPQPLPWAID